MRRPTQFNESGFDPPPGGGLLAVVALFERLGLVRRFGDRLGAVHFEELAGVTLNLGCVHRTLHGLFLRDGFEGWISPIAVGQRPPLEASSRRPREVARELG